MPIRALEQVEGVLDPWHTEIGGKRISVSDHSMISDLYQEQR